MCTASLADKPDALSGDLELNQVIDYLTLTCVNEIADPVLREAIEAASLVRRVTRPVLEAMLPDHSAENILANLRQLSFVEAAADGLVFHDAFRLATESRLAAMDPVRTRKRNEQPGKRFNARPTSPNLPSVKLSVTASGWSKVTAIPS